MTPCPDANVLAQLVDGALTDVERAPVERHLDDCGACDDLVAELAWIIAPPRSAPPGYRLRRQLDATTWEAEDARDGGRVVLRFGLGCDPARLTVAHPNLLAVHEVGTLAGERFLAHELVAMTAREWCDAAPRGADEILRVWRLALTGLVACHRAGLALGQVSPDHVWVATDDRVLVAGFGPALARGSGYLALDQLRGAAPTPASDQFSACVSIWEALAGQRPFAGATTGALAVTLASPPDLPAGGDRRVYEVLARGLVAEPGRRWPDVAALLAALGRVPGRTPIVPALIVLGIGLVVALLWRLA